MERFQDYELNRKARGGFIWELARAVAGALASATVVYVALALMTLSLGGK